MSVPGSVKSLIEVIDCSAVDQSLEYDRHNTLQWDGDTMWFIGYGNSSCILTGATPSDFPEHVERVDPIGDQIGAFTPPDVGATVATIDAMARLLEAGRK